jgi:hypothetical protein
MEESFGDYIRLRRGWSDDGGEKIKDNAEEQRSQRLAEEEGGKDFYHRGHREHRGKRNGHTLGGGRAAARGVMCYKIWR